MRQSNPTALPFLRLLTAAILTTPILWVYWDEVREIGRKSWMYIAAIGAIGLVAFSIFLLSGMQMVNGVVGAMVMSLSPAAVAVGASWYLHDKLGWRKWMAVISSVVDVVVINVAGKSFAARGAFELVAGRLLVFGAVCSATLYSLFAKRVSRGVRPVILVPLAAWIATFLFAGPGIFQAVDFDFRVLR